MSIRTKVLVVFVLAALLIAGVGYAGLVTAKRIQAEFEQSVKFDTPRVVALLGIRNAAGEIAASTVKLGQFSRESARVEGTLAAQEKFRLLAMLERVQTWMTQYRRHLGRSDTRRLAFLRKLDASTGAVVQGAFELIELVETKAPQQDVRRMTRTLEAIQDELKRIIDEAMVGEIDTLNARSRRTEGVVAGATRTSLVLSIASVIFAFAIGGLLSRLITANLARRAEAMRRLADTGTVLMATAAEGEIYAATLEAALRMLDRAATIQVGLAIGSEETMAVVATAGDPIGKLKGAELHLSRLPDALRARLIAGETIDLGASDTTLRTMLGFASSPSYVFLAPLPIKHELKGVLVVTGRSKFLDEHKDVLKSLSVGAALSLERAALTEDLAFQALHDPLTHLANRTLFRDRLGHALARAVRHSESLAVLFLDLDDFKNINDRLGHAAGDQALIAVAGRLRESVRTADTVARLGGDEFGLLLETVDDSKGAVTAAERVIEALRPPLTIQGQEIRLLASIGIAFSAGGQGRADDLIRNADLAMYRAKTHGKARYEIFEPEMAAATVSRLQLDADLQHAVEHREFTAYYQPIVALPTGRIVGMEALVRWHHPKRGLLSPGEFIPLAEETGLILPIGQWMLQQACRQGAEWRVRHPEAQPLSISVNLSARQLQHPGLVDEIAQALKATGFDAERLVIEITESVLIQSLGSSIHRLQELKALGVRLAIDDFGTGYSSLSYLRHLPVDVIKVAKLFIDDIGRSGDTTLTHAIIELGHALHLKVVAEGVELPEQIELLRDLGCDLGQGYYFARPLDAAGIDALLDSPSLGRERQAPPSAVGLAVTTPPQ